MAKNETTIDLEIATLDPTAVFRNPEDVLDQAELTQTQKVEILRRWEYDAHALEVAEEGNMASAAFIAVSAMRTARSGHGAAWIGAADQRQRSGHN